MKKVIILTDTSTKQIEDVEKFLNKKKVSFSKFDDAYGAWIDGAAADCLHNSILDHPNLKLKERETRDKFIINNKKKLSEILYMDENIINMDIVQENVNKLLEDEGYINQSDDNIQSLESTIISNDPIDYSDSNETDPNKCLDSNMNLGEIFNLGGLEDINLGLL